MGILSGWEKLLFSRSKIGTFRSCTELRKSKKADGEVEVLTKGDNNRVDDRGLYAPGQLWLQREDILGRARGTLRYLGMVTIILNDYPVLKYVLIGIMGLFVLTNKES